MNLKPYLVFIGENYYPPGGWQDFKDSFDTREEARHFIEKVVQDGYDWGQIIFTGDSIEELLGMRNL
ncbi:hypothetical protein LCGC14_0729490 [marine sediment metagenome]|uniref:Uncharacterized protein n=1 Tax=marine sediment metagenome TaxID=412755 RepID=A0A0F9QV19_9ZZZZ